MFTYKLLADSVFFDFREKERPTNVHAVPNAGTGEGIPLQPVPDEAAAHRNSSRFVSHREADQNLVPESPHEMEERK